MEEGAVDRLGHNRPGSGKQLNQIQAFVVDTVKCHKLLNTTNMFGLKWEEKKCHDKPH